MIKINLLADRHFKDRLDIQREIVLGVVVLLVALGFSFMYYQAQTVRIADTKKKIVQADKELAKQKGIREKIKLMEAKQAKLESVLDAIKFLGAIKQGPTMYFDTMNVILPPEIWLTSVDDSGGRMTIKGYSFSQTAVAKLMHALKGTGRFFDIELKEITKTKVAKETIKQFTVACVSALGRQIAKRKAEAEAAKKAKEEKNRKRKGGARKKKTGH